ncbi:oligogalacturonate lyase [Spirochaetia bacterium]|nr:oligogalacturonate lyase [Spirochaetia bacterium]
MAKGAVYKNEFYTYQDSHTGRTVVRLTPPDCLNHHPYFYNKMFTNDGKKLVYAGMRDGDRNYYFLDLENGESLQLTDGKELADFGAQLTSDDAFLIFTRGAGTYRMDMKSLKEELLYETPDGWKGYANPGMSSDNTTFVSIEMNKADMVPPTGNWDLFSTQLHKKPLCRIVIYDTVKKERRVIHEEKCWLGHPQLRPYDNNTVMFCHEGPWHEVDARLWLIDADGTNMRCAKPRTDPSEQMGHEYWLADGSSLAYIHFASATYGSNASVRLVNPKTLEETILMPCSGYSHFISNRDNTAIVGDGTKGENLFVYLVDVAAKKEQKLCWHGTSEKSYGTTQDAHVHAAFTPDCRKVVFTSDREGIPCIYMVTI